MNSTRFNFTQFLNKGTTAAHDMWQKIITPPTLEINQIQFNKQYFQIIFGTLMITKV